MPRIPALVLGAVALLGSSTIANVPAHADGGHVVAVTEDAVVVTDASGGDRRTVPGIPAPPACTEWRCREPRPIVGPADVSPDGRSVAYVGNDLDGGGLFVQDLAGGARRLLDPATSALTRPVWSPDGSRIAYDASDGIVTVRPDGSERVVHPRPAVADVVADWDAGGGLLVRHEGPCGTEVRRLGGGAVEGVPLTTGFDDDVPRGLRDGAVLVLRRDVVAPDGSCVAPSGAARLSRLEPTGGSVTTVREVALAGPPDLVVVPDGTAVLRRLDDPDHPGYDRWLRSAVDGSGIEEPVPWLDGAFHVGASTGAAPAVEVSADAGTEGREPPFDDIAGNQHEAAIAALAQRGVTTGCDDTGRRFCPDETVTRAQLATLLVRALELPPTGADAFVDDDADPHEESIDRLAAADVAQGVAEGRFAPAATVTRAQVATFLTRAWQLPSAARGPFADVDGVHADAVHAAAAAGITTGCVADGDRYCPLDGVRRDQLASMLAAALERAPSG